MVEVRIHGRGGQGVVTASDLLAMAAFTDGHHTQAFPSFGSERTGEPVLTMERTAYDAANEVIEFGTHIYNAELYSFRFTLHDSQSN
ncbi:pyruvate/2-ketoisovalerate family 2-oxoacid:acceptor oxidoreductase, gamma subunit [Schaalia turicensis ACS-279-V-Col4]|uniref:Pyruvate/2-ketoisovalerate family 2-oxoacid:acceptor oxidoreductase, gamma subunit n=1 Tax=Schaalia turicensis ACS-279-V-Col4 TaxID=883077 RepID=K0YVP3_9ACTO|nr:2-oxoacid:acceptor oxidoreductase family protein [Schaalia turicensis]EJZ87716.1 pyruvate/2-ketoisovalerate family 2-oxoacid:acceptor oxidoreductase, gamma subunit [Schaalia turicensis ACS-279-V-Col4]